MLGFDITVFYYQYLAAITIKMRFESLIGCCVSFSWINQTVLYFGGGKEEKHMHKRERERLEKYALETGFWVMAV